MAITDTTDVERLKISILSTLRRTDELFRAGKHAEACGRAEEELRHVLRVLCRSKERLSVDEADALRLGWP